MTNDFTLLMPEFLVTGLAFLVLTADFVLRSERKHLLAYLSVAGLLGEAIRRIHSGLSVGAMFEDRTRRTHA